MVRKNNWRKHHINSPRESVFQDKVMKRLRMIPKSFWHKINDRVSVGVPDILGAVNGYSVVIELKTRSKLTRLQLHNLEKAHKANCQSFVMVPENMEEILVFLHSLALIPTPPIASLRKPARIPLWTLPFMKENDAQK